MTGWLSGLRTAGLTLASGGPGFNSRLRLFAREPREKTTSMWLRVLSGTFSENIRKRKDNIHEGRPPKGM